MERLLIWFGLIVVGMGLLLVALGAFLSVVGSRGGRLLPGDIVISRPGFTFIFPLATSILLSLALTIILWLFFGWRK